MISIHWSIIARLISQCYYFVQPLSPYLVYLTVCFWSGVYTACVLYHLIVDVPLFVKSSWYNIIFYIIQCCFPPNLAAHTCKYRYNHTQYGSAMTWDEAIQSSVRQFEHKSYNLFTCNCHSFVANCLNRLCYDDSLSWNMINVAALLLFKGQWVDTLSVVRSFFPVILMLCLGISVVGWPFLIGLISFSVLLICWFVFGTYYVKSLFEC